MSTSSIRNPIPWGQLTVEGIAIIVSILQAFWIDAWWDDRQNVDEEREILIGLETEFVDLKQHPTGQGDGLFSAHRHCVIAFELPIIWN
jgi:hypothetical protein